MGKQLPLNIYGIVWYTQRFRTCVKICLYVIHKNTYELKNFNTYLNKRSHVSLRFYRCTDTSSYASRRPSEKKS